MSKHIQDIADYPALKKLAAALWQQESAYNGAAVMIGAGFSRSAALSSDSKAKLPLWNDLSKALAKDLNAENWADPLRLAEEYYAYFGKQSLHDVIKKEVRDLAWRPGELHKSVLKLPWSEVLTTNWDTLLERASLEVHKPVYSLVSRQEDLASSRSPRIVKLHGTLHVTDDLIFTQEDYRKYPERHAAFVNFVRQVFIENELCLLGFSGDDPNFLQWAGWVRDHLATHVRRIYLVGALNLTAAKRKYLESINVAPIDLNVLVEEYDSEAKHVVATQLFIQSLHDLKPAQSWEWSPTNLRRQAVSSDDFERTDNNPSYAARLLEGQISTLTADRDTYPSWLICPVELRWKLKNQVSDPYPSIKNLSNMESSKREILLYEIMWRHSVSFEGIPAWLVKELLPICNPAQSCELTKKQQLEVALAILKNTRWSQPTNESQQIEAIVTSILEREVRHWPESENELIYHQAMVARDRFDYLELERLADKISASDALWCLKKSSLFAELGRFDVSEDMIFKAYRELLGEHRKEKNSIHILSRLAWAHWLIRGIEAWKPGVEFKAFPSIYQDPKCSPWDHIEHLNSQISKAMERQAKQQEIDPSFEPGSYRDGSNTVTFVSEPNPYILLEAISSAAGVPLYWDRINFLGEPATKLTELDVLDDVHRFSIAIRVAGSDTANVIKKVFSRTKIACLSTENVDYLLEHCRGAVNYWCSRRQGAVGRLNNFPLERLRVFIEVLARISVRASIGKARELFLLAVELGKREDLQDLWLCDSIKHLLSYSLSSIPESEQYELLLDALSFPLLSETKFDRYEKWPNPIIKHPGVRSLNTALDRRIDEIIDLISPCSARSSPALLRLLPLLEHGFLTALECKKIAGKIWGDAPDYNHIPETGLLSYVLLDLPSADYTKVKELVRAKLFNQDGKNLFSSMLLTDIAAATSLDKAEGFPSEVQAITYFDLLVSWRPVVAEEDILEFSKAQNIELGNLVGRVLARSVIPSLGEQLLNVDRFNRLRSFYKNVATDEVIIAFPHFVAHNEVLVGDVEKIISQGLKANKPSAIAFASYALLKWKELNELQVPVALISRLVYQIESNRRNGLVALLWTANQLHERNYLSAEHIESLADNLPVIFDSSDYGNILPFSRESVSASLVRAACVRLAIGISQKSQSTYPELLRLVESANQDPLPEVRFARFAEI